MYVTPHFGIDQRLPHKKSLCFFHFETDFLCHNNTMVELKSFFFNMI